MYSDVTSCGITSILLCQLRYVTDLIYLSNMGSLFNSYRQAHTHKYAMIISQNKNLIKTVNIIKAEDIFSCSIQYLKYTALSLIHRRY